ncbi:hypothetical protein ACFQT0_20595 [Hymenobacter humi]|uniref:Uncharacterized protein n=1 Tax=Hymenobacter humi TaxID=1411620 RepID=A0ABW2U9K5_9BACT
MVNLDPHKALKLETALAGVNWKNVTGCILTSANINDYNTFDKPNIVKLASFAGAKKRGTGPSPGQAQRGPALVGLCLGAFGMLEYQQGAKRESIACHPDEGSIF